MRVMVTGSAGFIGSAVSRELKKDGHKVVPFDRQHGDTVENSNDVFNQMRGCSAVIHLAGVLGTAELFDDPYGAVDVNVNGTLNVLLAARSNEAHYVGITMPQVWDNVYQATKGCAKTLASAWHRHYGLPVSHVRAFNVFGPGQKVYGVQKIVPTFATKAWRNQPIPIWGDGTQTVDMVHVDDVAKILVNALEHGNDDVFDAGTRKAMSVREVANLVIERTGSTAGVDYLPMRLGEHEAKIVASGEGWEKLWHTPEFEIDRFNETVDYYKETRR